MLKHRVLSSSSRSVSHIPSRRLISTLGPKPIPLPGTPLPIYRRRPILTACLALPFVVAGSVSLVILGLLAFDASTYSEKHADRVPVDPLALHPGRGGKKNLKIAKVLVDDSDEGKGCDDRQKLVIVGGGWGAVGVIKSLDPKVWHVTVLSPQNYFLFHPLLRTSLPILSYHHGESSKC